MKFKTNLINGKIFSQENNKAHTLFDKSNMGSIFKQGIIELNLYEAMYLLEKRKIDLFFKNELLTDDQIINKFVKLDKQFLNNYCVYKDLRSKGYILKSGFKYGSNFIVYPKGKKPNKTHSKWICFVKKESDKLNLYEFASKHRIAHSTKKNIFIAIILNDNNSILYYESNWIKP